MNRGHLLESSPVQQMMAAGSPNWWSTSNMIRPPPSSSSQQASSFVGSPPNLLIPNAHYMPTSSSTLPLSSSSWGDDHHHHHNHHNQDQLPESWSQLLLGGLVSEEDQQKSGMQAKKLENWEEQLLLSSGSVHVHHQLKNESSGNGYNLYDNAEFHTAAASARPTTTTWSQMMPVSSPTSCITSLSSNMLDFSSNNKSDCGGRHSLPDRSSECNSAATIVGGVAKRARVQPSSTMSSFKVRKEKLGDRITALHQLVSPFGKTDTASVLLEAIGYIRFLQSQIEALSLPYLGSSKSGNVRQQKHHSELGLEFACGELVQGGDQRNCLFPEDPGQLLNENCMKRKAMSDQDCDEEEPKKDLRSRGLCLVPISCTLQVGSDNGADYWAPAIGGGFR